ncbi:MAG: TldD/PmbA family protein [Armatimonadetes bacterium]|nr:TldD/PmbA family protein [Armatimonadota bacterium]
MRELLEELVQRGMRAGAQFAEVRAGTWRGASVTAEDGRIHRCSTYSSRGAGLRVLVRGAWGFASTDNLDPTSLRTALDEAIAMASAASPRVAQAARVAEAPSVEALSRAPVRMPPDSVSLSERVGAVAAFEERLRKHHTAIVNTIVNYTDGGGVTELVNSFGSYVRWEGSTCSLYLTAVAANETTRQSAFSGYASPRGFEVVADLDPDEVSDRTAQRAVDLLSAAEPPAGSMPVIVDPEITGLIVHEAFGHNCEADLVWAGESIVAGKEGQQVAAECVTIVDDPTWDWHNGSFEYDDEGVPARRHVLVQSGVLTEYLYDLEMAAHFGVAPNGAARAGSYHDRPLPRMSNTFMEPGDAELEDLIASVDRGVLICGDRGGYVDTTRGHFTFFAETGFEILDGRLGRQIRNCTLSGYTLETLRGVLGLSRDFGVADRGTCGKHGQGVRVSLGGPHMLVREITVGGSRIGEDT